MTELSTVTVPNAETVPTSSLKADGQNPNKMSREQLDRLKTSIKKFGFIVPIITNKDLLIADGEQRWIVANELAMPNVLVIRLPVEDVDRRLLRQVLNKLRGEHELLADALEFEKIIELGREDDLKYLLDLNDTDIEKYLTELHPAQEDDYDTPELEDIETTIKRGDIIWLGNHRLMCGDATKDCDFLLSGEKADLLLTDPPYGINVVGQHKIGGDKETTFGRVIGSDNKVKAGVYYAVIGDEKPFDPQHLFPLAPKQLMFGANYYADKLPASPCWLVWDKEGGKEWLDSFADCELIWGNFENHAKIYRCLWKGMVKEGESGHRMHPTQKPIKLLSDILQDFSEPKQTIIDPYGGSGSTLIACEQTSRVCYMMEIDPRYCEIICQRWEKYAGQKRVKIGENNVPKNRDREDN